MNLLLLSDRQTDRQTLHRRCASEEDVPSCPQTEPELTKERGRHISDIPTCSISRSRFWSDRVWSTIPPIPALVEEGMYSSYYLELQQLSRSPSGLGTVMRRWIIHGLGHPLLTSLKILTSNIILQTFDHRTGIETPSCLLSVSSSPTTSYHQVWKISNKASRQNVFGCSFSAKLATPSWLAEEYYLHRVVIDENSK